MSKKNQDGTGKPPVQEPAKEKKPGRMLPKKSTVPVEDITVLAENDNIPAWELAGIMKAAGWAEGKRISGDEFTAAVKKFRNRPQGGGRI